MAYPLDADGGGKWNGDAFASSLGADLLTFSVAPLTHVMKTVGSTLQQHDTLLDELAAALAKLQHLQQETNQTLVQVKANDPSAIRDEVLEMVDGLQKRIESSEADIAQAAALSNALGGKVAIIEEHEAKLDGVEANVQDLASKVDHMSARMSDFLLPNALEGLKAQILDELQDEILAHIRAEIGARRSSKPAPSLGSNGSDLHTEESTNDASASTMEATTLGNIPDNESDDDDDEVEVENNASSNEGSQGTDDSVKATEQTSVHVAPAKQELETSDMATTLVPAATRHGSRRATGVRLSLKTGPATDELETQLRELNARVARAERDREDVLERMAQLQQSVTHELREVSGRPPTFASPAVLEPKAPTELVNAAYETALETQLAKIMELTKQLQALQGSVSTNAEGVDANKTAIKATQDDLRKLRRQVDEFQETQQLMQSFAPASSSSTSSGEPSGTSAVGGGPDLSMVFAKLAEMRQAQVAASEELREALDTVVEKSADQGREMHKWVEAVQRLGAASVGHVDAEARKLKETLQRQLHQQAELISSVNEWLPLGHDIHHDLHHPDGRSPASRIAELQNLARQYHLIAPAVMTLVAAPGAHQTTLLRLRHALVDAPDGAEKIATSDLLQAATHDVSALDKANETLLRAYDQARVMIDELWSDWYDKQHSDTRQMQDQLAKDVVDLRQIQQVLARPAAPSGSNVPKESERKASHVAVGVLDNAGSLSGHHNEALKKMEQLLLTAQRRMDGFEDDLRVLSRNVLAYRNDLADKVTEGHLAKLRFQIYSELAKIHTFMGSSKFSAPPKMSIEHLPVYDDADIKGTLDAQAEMIAKLCAELKKEKDDRERELRDKESARDPGTDAELNKISAETDRFNTRLESITEKVAEMFVSLEVNRSATQPRHTIPIFNPAQMLDSFAQTIEAKLAETQDLTKKDIERIRAELGDNVRARVRRAMESLKDQMPSGLDSAATTAVGTVCCIACSRPVRFDVSTGDVVREVPGDMLGLPHHHDDEETGDRDDPEFVYRAGFRMPVNDKKNILPLLVSPRLPAKGRLEKPKGRRLVKKDTNRVDSLLREVDELDQSAMTMTERPAKSIDKKAIEARRPIAPARP
ncbi:hypothetical protein SDRG_03401 [Saprolegnia diclina VS20]|uniref:Uncharacterized protein n=1 Tax=Saprolegnia diclina (strain VS20) TaxID=1156394 RepID=T0QWX7_SAPDV|nr:hypothetical protein SDRG_03401 [Saprolegnia diclina VS20]EQC39196.1 hypothetical protein SDRG_03401 [Saprolegnia diclina VS20]|eukprot:XP_008607257.1 hypothetical protein SDRG_03401 [Saprolegnia diclina VS20]